MKISGYAKQETQRWLFERPLGNHGHVRNVIGDQVERIVACLVGGRRHKTGGGDYCPDVSVMIPTPPKWQQGIIIEPPDYGKIFIECKAAGNSKQTFIYAGRVEKDRKFAEERVLYYAIVHHGLNTKDYETVEELQRALFPKLKCLYFVPFDEIDRLCVKEEPLNSGYGGTDRRTYGSGFRIPLGKLEDWKVLVWGRNENAKHLNGSRSQTMMFSNSSAAENTESIWRQDTSSMLRTTNWELSPIDSHVPTNLFISSNQDIGEA